MLAQKKYPYWKEIIMHNIRLFFAFFSTNLTERTIVVIIFIQNENELEKVKPNKSIKNNWPLSKAF
jgi:hypothetical protein